MRECPVEVIDDHVGLLVHPDYQGQVDSGWFDVSTWRDRAVPVSRGGRGGAWFIRGERGEWVLRHYRRGGLIARLSTYSYFFTGPDRTRSVAEFRLLRTLNDWGLPVPVPVAAMYRKAGLFRYQAGIIVERIDGVETLAEACAQLTDHDWATLGAVIRRFHDADVCHADLNSFNILIREHDFYLIDFDKCRILSTSGLSNWRRRNLQRLARSLEKVEGATLVQRVWPFVLSGYNGSKTN